MKQCFSVISRPASYKQALTCNPEKNLICRINDLKSMKKQLPCDILPWKIDTMKIYKKL